MKHARHVPCRRKGAAVLNAGGAGQFAGPGACVTTQQVVSDLDSDLHLSNRHASNCGSLDALANTQEVLVEGQVAGEDDAATDSGKFVDTTCVTNSLITAGAGGQQGGGGGGGRGSGGRRDPLLTDEQIESFFASAAGAGGQRGGGGGGGRGSGGRRRHRTACRAPHAGLPRRDVWRRRPGETV